MTCRLGKGAVQALYMLLHEAGHEKDFPQCKTRAQRYKKSSHDLSEDSLEYYFAMLEEEASANINAFGIRRNLKIEIRIFRFVGFLAEGFYTYIRGFMKALLRKIL
jgi:hypothetical protein